MDCVQELIALSVDAVLLGLCIKDYYTCKSITNSLKNAPQMNIDNSLKEKLQRSDEKKIPYGVIRGTVTPMGIPLKGAMAPNVTGVLQIIKLNEHLVARGFAGFWTEQRKLVHISCNEMPFTINNGKNAVEVIDALSAELLDMDTVYDHYEPSSLSFFDHVFGFFTGVRQRGFQTTEELLRDESFITAVGELELDGDKIRLQTSPVGPMFLTTSTKNALVKRFQDAASSSLFKSLVLGTIAAVLIAVIGRKVYRRKKAEWDEKKIREALEKSRQKRRALARSNHVEYDESQKCVVCLSNPKEVIVLPCGHVCLCEDCSTKISLNCPVCRTKIESKAAAFIT